VTHMFTMGIVALIARKYCKIIKDKNTGESKGFAYAKYDKASSAALAIESLNGKKISEDQPAFKVRRTSS
jgi:hypothetical protein